MATLWTILQFLLIFSHFGGNQAFMKGLTMDYCQAEDFRIRCNAGEVILMQSALFGRMNRGRCITSELGFMGCYSNVLPLLDGKCSGRQECEILKITEEDFSNGARSGNECHIELRKYLETQHICLKELPTSNLCDRMPFTLELKDNPGIVYSENVNSLRCLSDPHKSSFSFLVSTSLGQQINSTLIDLGVTTSTNAYNCDNYGSVVEMKTGQQTMICGGHERSKWLMMSNSNQMEIRIEKQKSKKFMLQFEAVGCPNIRAPAGGMTRREGSNLIVTCYTSDQTWQLHCEGNRRKGVIGNCSSALPKVSRSNQKMSSTQAVSSDVWLALIIACGVIVCVSAITFGVVCWRRRTLESEIAKMKSGTLKVKGKPGKAPADVEYMFPNFRPRSTMSETEDAVYDFCFSPGPVPNNMTSSVTLPCRNSANLQYNNPVGVSGAPESPKYKTLVFIKP